MNKSIDKKITKLQIVGLAVLAELMLFIMQFIYLNRHFDHPGSVPRFTASYMKTTGFYVFQIMGFFIYTGLVYYVTQKLPQKILSKIFLLVVTGSAMELTFYLLMHAPYEGAFLYSILDKLIAAAFGIILFNYTSGKKKEPGSYV